MTPLEAAWRSLHGRWAGSFAEFVEATKDWEVHPVHLDGEVIGAVLVNGPEIHACVTGGFGRWMRKEQLRILNAVIEKHGYATTAATTEAGEAFVHRLGFEKHGNSYRRSKKWALKQ